MKKIFFHVNKAFTIIELLIVVTIIAILATLVMINLSGMMAKSRDSQRKSDLTQIASALENYRTDNKVYPQPVSLVFVLASTGITTVASTFSSYLPVIPTDPRDPESTYQYKSDGQQFKLINTVPETLVGVIDDTRAKSIADEFFDPANRNRFQISSSMTALGW